MALYDDLINSDTLTREQKAEAIKARGEAERNAYDTELNKAKGRMLLGSILSGASMHPIFNIPYVGTGIGGALYDAGQAIVEGDKLPDIAKRAGRGFAIGETVGAIPYVGKAASKTKAGQAIGNQASKLFDYLADTKVGQKVAEIAPKVEDVLMTDITGKLRKGYHGTKYKGNITKFDENLIGSNTGNEGYSGRGFYFSTDPYEASTYGDNILKRYIVTKKPFIANKENIAKYAENFGYTKEPVGIDQEWLLNSLKNKDKKAYKLANEIIKNGEEKGWDNFLFKYGGEDNILNLNSVGSWANATKLSNSSYKEPLSDYIINDLTQNLGIPKTINDFKYLPNLDYMLDLGKSSRAFTDMLKKDGYDSVIDGTEIVAFSPEQIKTSLYDYLANDSVLTKGFRQNKDIIDKTLLNSVRRGQAGLNPLGKRQGEILYNELSNNSNNILDLTGVFDTKVSNSEVKNYIQSLVNEGAMQTKSPDFLIDIPDHRKYKKHIQFRDKWQKLPREVQERHNALALRLKEIINNSEYSAPPKPNNNPAKKGNVDQYHYFTVKVRIGDEVIPIVLDAEQLIGESTVKPQTVHLYNFKEKK